MNGYQAVAYPMFAADGQIVTEQRHGNSGDHRAEGIFIASGPAIRSSNHTLTPAHITYLALGPNHSLPVRRAHTR